MNITNKRNLNVDRWEHQDKNRTQKTTHTDKTNAVQLVRVK